MPRRGPSFQPRFTLTLLYLVLFFMLYALLLVAPELAALSSDATRVPGDVLHERSRQATQRALGGGKAWLAFAAALATVGLCAWRRWLPGMR